EAHIQMVHVPYKGIAPAITDVIGGQVDAAFTSVPSVIQHVKAGAVRALAVSSAERSPVVPDVPAVAEAGLGGFDVNPWWGVLAPAGTPAPVVRRLHDDIADAVKAPDVAEHFKAQ